MATRTEIILTDDLDGGPAERTVRLALDGQDYETELGAAHIAQLEDGLAPFIAAARVVPNGNARGKRGRKTPGRAAPATVLAAPDVSVDNEAIRRWAQAERPDLGVKDRGRVPSAATAAYNAARGLE